MSHHNPETVADTSCQNCVCLSFSAISKVKRSLELFKMQKTVAQSFSCRILGLQPHDKVAMLVVCWWSIQYNFFSKNLHEHRV